MPKAIRLSHAARIISNEAQSLALSGQWTAFGLGILEKQIDSIRRPRNTKLFADATQIELFDTAGAWVLQSLLLRLEKDEVLVTLIGLRPEFGKLLAFVDHQIATQMAIPHKVPLKSHSLLDRLGRAVVSVISEAMALLTFVGESANAFGDWIVHPSRIRWRPILFNIRSAGVDALPIVGLLSFLLGVVVAYQSADQLMRYGANIFIADIVGISMLREFAPLVTAIIIAGRSGSAYAAQIGTMVVTEEMDALRTIGIAPQELLVLPKLFALVLALPLLTVFADALGVAGGMLMARMRLDVGYDEFLERFIKAVAVRDYLIGVLKAPVFAAIIVIVGCFQGFRTQGGADGVGQQTTRSVVWSIFLVIVVDAVFSVALNALDL